MTAANKPPRAGEWRNGVPIPRTSTFEENEHFLEGEDKDKFINFVRAMLQRRPEDQENSEGVTTGPMGQQSLTKHLNYHAKYY